MTKRIDLKHVHTLFITMMLDQYHMHDIRVHQYITPSHEICGSNVHNSSISLFNGNMHMYESKIYDEIYDIDNIYNGLST